jgi:hypothetical protein
MREAAVTGLWGVWQLGAWGREPAAGCTAAPAQAQGSRAARHQSPRRAHQPLARAVRDGHLQAHLCLGHHVLSPPALERLRGL